MREKVSMPLLESHSIFRQILKTFTAILKAEVNKQPQSDIFCSHMKAAEKAEPQVEQMLKEMVDDGDLLFAPRFEIGILPHDHQKKDSANDIFIFKVEVGEMFEALGITSRGAIFVESTSEYVN